MEQTARTEQGGTNPGHPINLWGNWQRGASYETQEGAKSSSGGELSQEGAGHQAGDPSFILGSFLLPFPWGPWGTVAQMPLVKWAASQGAHLARVLSPVPKLPGLPECFIFFS